MGGCLAGDMVDNRQYIATISAYELFVSTDETTGEQELAIRDEALRETIGSNIYLPMEKYGKIVLELGNSSAQHLDCIIVNLLSEESCSFDLSWYINDDFDERHTMNVVMGVNDAVATVFEIDALLKAPDTVTMQVELDDFDVNAPLPVWSIDEVVLVVSSEQQVN